jgi:Mn2+/Fe2+ NRAMP family transporter
MKFTNWFSRFFSAEMQESSKRLAFIVLVVVFVVQFFLLMYIKIEIANKDLVKENQWYLFLLILILGGYIVSEMIFSLFNRRSEIKGEVDKEKAKQGISDTVVNQAQNVENQNISGKDAG